MLDAAIAELQHVDAAEQVLARAEEPRGNGKVHLIDEPGAQILLNGRYAAAESNVTSLRRSLGALERSVYPFGDEVEGRVARHAQRRARMVREHEDVGVVRRVLAPPT